MLLVASKSAHKKLSIPHVTSGNEDIVPDKEVNNIGFAFDHIMNAANQVNLVCKSAWYHLHRIAKIHPYLDTISTIVGIVQQSNLP